MKIGSFEITFKREKSYKEKVAEYINEVHSEVQANAAAIRALEQSIQGIVKVLDQLTKKTK